MALSSVVWICGIVTRVSDVKPLLLVNAYSCHVGQIDLKCGRLTLLARDLRLFNMLDPPPMILVYFPRGAAIMFFFLILPLICSVLNPVVPGLFVLFCIDAFLDTYKSFAFMMHEGYGLGMSSVN